MHIPVEEEGWLVVLNVPELNGVVSTPSHQESRNQWTQTESWESETYVHGYIVTVTSQC